MSNANTHPILQTHGQTTALLPIYDHNKLYPYTYRNIARTPIEVSGARRMTRQHSHLGPVFFQYPQLASPLRKINSNSICIKVRELAEVKVNGFPSTTSY